MKKKNLYLIFLFIVVFFFINNPGVFAHNEKRDFYIAQQSFGDGFYDTAIEKLKDYIANFPEGKNIYTARILLGRSYYTKGSLHLALGEFEKVISSNVFNDKAEAYYWMGKIYLETKDFIIARGFFKKIIEAFPESDFIDYAHYYLAVIANITGDYATARERSGYVIEKASEPQITEFACVELAKSLYGLREFEQSNNILKNHLKKYPQSLIADKVYFQLGENSFFAGNYLQAIDFYRKAVEVKENGENKEEALKKTGTAFFELKEYENAILAFDELIQANPKTLFLEEINYAKAQAAKKLGRADEAISCFEKVVELACGKPDYGLADDSYFCIADTYHKKADYDKAILFYKSFGQKFPQSSLKEEVLYNLAWTYLQLKHYEEAIVEFQKLTQKGISKDEILKIIALCRLGDTYVDKNEYKKAMEAYNEVLENYPNSFYSDYAQYQLAVVLEKTGHVREAMISLDALLRNFTKSKLQDQAHYLLALLYLKKGDYKKSVEHYRVIKNDFPNSQYRELAVLGDGYCCYNLKEFNNALEIFKEFEKNFPASIYIERVKYEAAQVLFACGREKEAKEKFIQLAKKTQDAEVKDEIMLWLAQYSFSAKDYDAARQQYELIVTETNSSYFKSLAYYWLGKIAFLKGEKDAALKFFEQAFNLSANGEFRLRINFEKADVLLENAELGKALTIYDDIIDAYPLSNFTLLSYKKRGDIKMSQGKPALARDDYKKALTEIKSDFNAEIQFQIAKTYIDEDKFTEALNELFAVVYLYADSGFWKEKALFCAADIYNKQGNAEEAKKIYAELSSSDTEVSKMARSKLETIKDDRE